MRFRGLRYIQPSFIKLSLDILGRGGVSQNIAEHHWSNDTDGCVSYIVLAMRPTRKG